MNAIHPISIDDDKVTLSRADWDAVIERLEGREDAAAISRHKAGGGPSYTAAETDRLLDGTHALTIWRERSGMTQKALAEAAGMSQSYVNEIEGGKKPGSAAGLAQLAAALGVSIERLLD